MKKLNRKKSLSVALTGILVSGMLALTACDAGNSKSKDDAQDTGDNKSDTLVVGLDDTFAPMGFRDDSGKLVGFDIDLATAVADELNLKVEFKPIDWNAKEMELKAGTIDCVWNGMSATPERIKNMALSYKYLNNKIVVMALRDRDVQVNASTDLEKLKIGTQTDSSALEMMKADPNFDKYSAQIAEYGTYDEAMMDLKTGRLDVIVVDQVLGEYMNKNLAGTDGEMKECGFSFGDDFYVIGFDADNTALRDKVNKALKALIDSGDAKEISNKWFGRNLISYGPVEGEE